MSGPDRDKRLALWAATAWYFQFLAGIPLAIVLFYAYFPQFPWWWTLAGLGFAAVDLSLGFAALHFDLRAERKGARASLVARAPFVIILLSAVFGLFGALDGLFVSLP